MTWNFPAERAAKRQALLDAVESVRAVVTSHAEEAERIRTLPMPVVDAMYDAGLFALKLASDLGGAEADPVTQLEVIEAMAYIEPSAGWCLMIGATAIGWPTAFLPDKAIKKIFANGVPRAATVAAPSGSMERVDGGYRVSGRWSFGSGVRHSQWIDAGIRVPSDDKQGWKILKAYIPTAEAEIHDNWQVLGLKGTGSNDFSVSNLLVSEDFIWDPVNGERKRGGPLYNIRRPGFVANEHSAFALGVARRALDEIIEIAKGKERGVAKPTLQASRATFQRFVGESDLKLRAARLLAIDILDRAWNEVCQGRKLTDELNEEMRSSALYATDVALDVVTQSFRFAGGSAIHESNTLQRCLRDMNVAAQHFMVSNTAYENRGQFILGIPEANPLG